MVNFPIRKCGRANDKCYVESFETENAILNIFRCPHAFVINKNKITWVKGNAAGTHSVHRNYLGVVSGEKAVNLKKQLMSKNMRNNFTFQRLAKSDNGR